MNPTAILFPAIVQAALTFVVLLMLGPARSRSIKESGQSIDDADVRLGRNRWSEQALQLSNNYKNQFELPVLFYAVVAYALITRSVDFLTLVLAWVFVVSRIVHAAVHVGPNIVRWRGSAFVIGVVALIALWVQLTLHIL